MRDVLRSRWMITAIFVEVLGFVAALGTIPGLGPFPVVAMLSATAILSSLGVVIVTTYFVVQYNRRPLNAVQTKEISERFEAYSTREEAEDAFAPKCQLASLGDELGSFLSWKYRNSVVDFASEVQGLRLSPGYIIVAELEQITDSAHIVRFALVPPPVRVVEDPKGSAGDTLPELYSDYGTLFESDTAILVVYLGVGKQLRVLRPDPGKQGAFYYYEELSSPVHSNAGTTDPKPRLQRNKSEQSRHGWHWDNAAD